MLKQQAFFELLKKRRLSPTAYYYIYQIHTQKDPIVKSSIIQLIKTKVPVEYIENTVPLKLSSKGIALIKSVEALFKPLKVIKTMDADFTDNLSKYIEIFPTGKLPTGKYARDNKTSIEKNMIWFLQEFDFDWNTILFATKAYVEEYRQKDFEYMRTAMYFIKKDTKGTITSDLATYCQAYLNGEFADADPDDESYEEESLGNVV